MSGEQGDWIAYRRGTSGQRDDTVVYYDLRIMDSELEALRFANGRPNWTAWKVVFLPLGKSLSEVAK